MENVNNKKKERRKLLNHIKNRKLYLQDKIIKEQDEEIKIILFARLDEIEKIEKICVERNRF